MTITLNACSANAIIRNITHGMHTHSMGFGCCKFAVQEHQIDDACRTCLARSCRFMNGNELMKLVTNIKRQVVSLYYLIVACCFDVGKLRIKLHKQAEKEKLPGNCA